MDISRSAAFTQIPAFYCPFPYAIAPEHAETDQRTVQWMDRFGMFGCE
ncbi:hypothetical protein C9F11_45205 (plasmid) [Streptomyces sp. YIM 121038]|nr:hypothetical protein C9F11_45205 [Streptomyces sp. YIM 121038]